MYIYNGKFNLNLFELHKSGMDIMCHVTKFYYNMAWHGILI